MFLSELHATFSKKDISDGHTKRCEKFEHLKTIFPWKDSIFVYLYKNTTGSILYWHHTVRHKCAASADYEGKLRRVDNNIGKQTKQYQRYEAAAFGLYEKHSTGKISIFITSNPMLRL